MQSKPFSAFPNRAATFCGLLLAILACSCLASGARAQFVAQVTQRDRFGNNSVWYPAVFCQGNNCVALAIGGVDGFPAPKSKFFFLRSIDGGFTWRVADSSNFRVADGWYANPDIARFIGIDSQHIILVGRSDTIFETSDGGDSWRAMNLPTARGISDISFSDSRKGFLVTSGTVDSMMATSDGGEHWNVAPLPVRVLSGVAQCHDYGEGKKRLFEYYYGRVYSTRDNWQTVDSTAPIVADSSIRNEFGFGHCSFGGGDTIFAYGNYFYRYPSIKPYAPLIAKTIDGGQNWSIVYDDTGRINGSVHTLSDIQRDTILAGLSQSPGGVLMSTDRGISWRAEMIVCSDSDFIPATNAGIGFTNQGDLVGAFGFGEILSTLIVGQRAAAGVRQVQNGGPIVYPNPVANVVRIILDLPDSRTQVSIVNSLGTVIAHFETHGKESITWDTHSVPNGTYFVRYVVTGGPHVTPIVVAH